MFKAIGRFSGSWPWLVCVLWLAVGAGLQSIAPNWDARTQDDDVRFLPQRCTSVRAYEILEKAFPQDVYASRLIFAVEREDRPLEHRDFELVDAIVADLHKLKEDRRELAINGIRCYQDGLIGNRLISKDKHCTLIEVSLGTPFLAVKTHDTVTEAEKVVHERIAKMDDPPEVYTTGQAGVGRDLLAATGEGLDRTTWATVILVVVILLCVYRSPLLALVPLLTIATSVWVSLNLLALMTLLPGVHLVNISKVFTIVILYGAGTDYCLFLISRYREELHRGRTIVDALAHSVGSVGGALAASAGTVMCGLGLMALAEFAKVRYSGPGIALSLAVALVAALTLTPALLRILGRIAFWPRRVPTAPRALRIQETDLAVSGWWDRISRFVVRRPLLVWSASLLLLLPLAGLGTIVRPDYRATAQLAADSPSLQGLRALKRHFPAGETGPITVLLVSSEPWDSPKGKIALDHLSRGFAALDNVAEVRSLTQPLGEPLDDVVAKKAPILQLFGHVLNAIQPGAADGVMAKAGESAAKFYLSRLVDESSANPLYVTRIHVVLKTDPYDPASLQTWRQVQTWLEDDVTRATLPPDVRSETYGVMVNAHDLATVTESDRTRVNLIILVGILAILLAIVRRPTMAIYLLVTVLLSYYATLGATALAVHLWGGDIGSFQLDWRVLFFLFTVLIAVGEDYNILLMSRAVEEQKRHGVIEGTRRAVATTGSTITSCGIIMAGTFATLMLTNLNSLLQIGFALAFGVLVDTFIVRPFLVPSFAILLARWGSTPPRKEPKLSKQPPPPSSALSRVPPALRAAG